jgi:hypothetical protein
MVDKTERSSASGIGDVPWYSDGGLDDADDDV